VEAGTAYLRELLIKYDGDTRRALAAYNAGPGAVDRYNGVPPYAETQTYVERVLSRYAKATAVTH
jgi:soluble lytic murein transglycosylase-like protein